MNKWNGKRFSVYESEEKAVLGLIKNLGEQTNYNTDEVEKVKESDNKKVSHDELQETYKLDKNANFTGSWHGIKKPTQSNEGLQTMVNEIIEETIPYINSEIDYVKSEYDKAVANITNGSESATNTEIVQARGTYTVLNERLESDKKDINLKTDNIIDTLINNQLAQKGDVNNKLNGTVTNGKNMQINGLGYCSIANGTTSYNILEYNLQGEKKLRVLCSYGADVKYSVGFAFCDNDLKVISQYNNSTSGSGYVIINVPKNAKKIIVNGTSGLVPTIEEHFSGIVSLNKFGYDYMKIFQRIAVIGDSLSSGELVYQDSAGTWQYVDKYGNSWLSYIARSINATRTHYSQGGITAKIWLDYYNHRLSSDKNYNAYFIALGTNDAYKKPYPLGSLNDVPGANTFVGYYKQIIDNIKTNAPNSVIFCCSRYSKNDTDGYNSMIKEITKLYAGVFFVDIANESSITLDVGGEYVNGSHFTTLGYLELSENIKRIVNNIIIKNASYFKYFLLNNDNEEKYQL